MVSFSAGGGILNMWWLTLSPDSKKVLGLNLNWDLSVRVHRSVGDSKLAGGVNVSVNNCFSLCALQ